MTPTAESPGSYLRRLRNSRRLTLRSAAGPMGLSPAALSRLERGERQAARTDIEAAVAFYHLTPWESFELNRLAGFLPSFVPEKADQTILQYSIELLGQVALPAVLADRFGYFRAWNGLIQSVWDLPTDHAPHAIDAMFSERVRTRLGGAWRARVVRALWIYYLRLLTSAQNDGHRLVAADLAERHGTEFVELWNEAQLSAASAASGDAPAAFEIGVVESYATPVGAIDFITTYLQMRVPTRMEIFMLVPYGQESQRLYSDLLRIVGPGSVLMSPDVSTRSGK